MVTSGRYRHYKGPEYFVIGCAKHTESGEVFVVYEALYGDHQLWIRPESMFLEHVKVGNQSVPRFSYIGSSRE